MTARPLFRVSRSYAAQAVEGKWLSRKNRIWVLIALAVAFFVRVNALAAQSLWNDEGTSVALAQTSIPAIINAAARDIHPPLYYFLLHVWIQGAGISEFAVRFLSVIAGVLVVALMFRIAREFFDQDVAVIAAVLSALNPFQTYYAQETRMYIWVTLFASFSVWAMVTMLKPAREVHPRPLPRQMRTRILALCGYILATIGALYTNYYAFTLILFENLAFLAYLVWARRERRPRLTHTIIVWIAAQVMVALAYLPWLAFARASITAWPGISEPITFWDMSWRIASAFVSASDVLINWQGLLVGIYLLFFVGGLLPSRDLFRQSAWGIVTCALWAVVPLLTMYVVSLSRPAYNPKFLLLATPGFLILVARGVSVFYPGLFLRERAPYASLSDSAAKRLARSIASIVKLAIGALFAAGTVLALQNMYTAPQLQRDDYRGIVNYINALATERDVVIVNAPGQMDVVRYYYRSPAKLVALPVGRPPNRAATQTALEELATRENIFGIYWAAEQADPDQLIERYLAETTYKASDEWHGNVRLAQYTLPTQAELTAFQTGVHFGDEIVLEGYKYSAPPLVITDFAPVELEWRPLRFPPTTRYKVFAQLLDAQGQLVSQRDAEPGDGFRPTDQWKSDATVIDRLAIPIPPGLASGAYSVIVGLYRADNGARLPASSGGDYFTLGSLQVAKKPLSSHALFLTPTPNAILKDISLLGYEFEQGEANGFARGEFIPLVLYFQARAKPAGDLLLEVQLRDSGNNVLAAARAFENYPSSRWDENEIVRDVQYLNIPPDALPGAYKIVVTDGTSSVEVTRVQVR